MTEPTVIPVTGAAPYDVVIGHGLADRLHGLLGEGVQRVALIYAGPLAVQAEAVAEALVEHYEVLALGLPGGEEAKTASVANDCWAALGENGFCRNEVFGRKCPCCRIVSSV